MTYFIQDDTAFGRGDIDKDKQKKKADEKQEKPPTDNNQNTINNGQSTKIMIDDDEGMGRHSQSNGINIED